MNPGPPTPPFSDPGPTIRALIALLLRVGLGFGMLNRGILSYLSMRGRTLPGFGLPRSIAPAVEVYYPYAVYAEMAIGLALILGFFTTATAVLAGVLQLVAPVIQTAMALGGFDPYQGSPGPNISLLNIMAETGMSNLLVIAAVLWFSPVTSNPWSLDSLIYSRREGPVPPEPAGIPARDRPSPEPTAPTPPPGERSKTFIANREE